MDDDMKAFLGAIVAAPLLYALLWLAMALF